MRPLAFALCHLLTCVLTKILRPWDTPQLSKQFVFDLIDDSNDNILLFEGLQAVCKTLGLRRIESNQLCKVFVKFIDGFFPIWEDGDERIGAAVGAVDDSVATAAGAGDVYGGGGGCW